MFSLEMQFWTSRGFAVCDVNYGGSTGYGRAYRERLNGQWGVVDLQDCLNAARHLAETGEVDGERLLITGGSAGGYTTICALTFTDAFAAGASYFGLADLEAFGAGDTHKFELRYEHTLVGPYPERADLYRERSPIHYVDRISTPMLVLQGADDEVVPPAQAEVIVAALRERGVPHAYLLFEGEGHGFRKAENIVRSLEAELSFYLQVLGLEPGDPLPKLEIEHLSS
jgi:dipeptidyl aminopeptidase/acylaminoacyl peptidase